MIKHCVITASAILSALLLPTYTFAEVPVKVLVGYDSASYSKDPTLHTDVFPALRSALRDSELSHLTILDATSGGLPPVTTCRGTASTTGSSLISCAEDALAGTRDLLDADVVLMIVDEISGNTVGQAKSVPLFVSHTNWREGYAVIQDDFFRNDDSLATHEFGHLLYNEHDGTDMVWGEPAPDPRNHGYTSFVGSTRKTTMVQGGENRFNQYSRATGKFLGTSVTRGNARSNVAAFIDDPISGSWDQVALYLPREPMEPRPVSPVLIAQTLYCFGWYRVEWSDVPGVDRYELWRSSYSNFAYAQCGYSGTGTHTRINVANNSWLKLKVRACNGSGCSEYDDDDVTIQWLPYCY